MDKNVFNYDETRINIPENLSKRVFTSNRPNINNYGLRQKPLATLISFISANGELFMSVYLLKTLEIEGIEEDKLSVYFPINKPSTRSTVRRYFGYTKSGYMNSSIFRITMEKFSELWEQSNPGLHCYVFGDQFGAHLDLETIQNCLKRFVFLWSLPSNTSHFLQPLDNLCFAVLKKKFKSKIEEVNLKVFLNPTIKNQELFAAMYEAEKESFSRSIIISSFKNTGLYPFDPNLIKKLTQENIGKFKITEDEMVQNVSEKMVIVFDDISNQYRSNKVQKISPSGPFLHAPENRIEEEDKKREDRLRIQKEKEQKQKEREQALLERKIRKEKNKCVIEGCKSVRQSSKSWMNCKKCDGLICPKDKKRKEAHESSCSGVIVE